MSGLDEDRLNGLARIIEESDGGTLSIGGTCHFGINLGRKRIGEGPTLRDAIDAALSRLSPAKEETP